MKRNRAELADKLARVLLFARKQRVHARSVSAASFQNVTTLPAKQREKASSASMASSKEVVNTPQ